MHGLRGSALAPFNKGHLLSGGGIEVGYPVFIDMEDIYKEGAPRSSIRRPNSMHSNSSQLLYNK